MDFNFFLDEIVPGPAGVELAGIVFDYLEVDSPLPHPKFYSLFLAAMDQKGRAQEAKALVQRSIEQIRFSFRGHTIITHAIEQKDWMFFQVILESRCPLMIGEIFRVCALCGDLQAVDAIMNSSRFDASVEEQIDRAIESLCYTGHGINAKEILDKMVGFMRIVNDEVYESLPSFNRSQYNGMTMALNRALNTNQQNFIEYVRQSDVARSRVPRALLESLFPEPKPSKHYVIS